jgi:hypothetical protein
LTLGSLRSGLRSAADRSAADRSAADRSAADRSAADRSAIGAGVREHRSLPRHARPHSFSGPAAELRDGKGIHGRLVCIYKLFCIYKHDAAKELRCF